MNWREFSNSTLSIKLKQNRFFSQTSQWNRLNRMIKCIVLVQSTCNYSNHAYANGRHSYCCQVHCVLHHILHHAYVGVALILELPRVNSVIINRLVEGDDPVGLKVHGHYLPIQVLREEGVDQLYVCWQVH